MGQIVQRAAQTVRSGFGDLIAASADQKNRRMGLTRRVAGGIGVQALNAMGKPVFDQKIQGTIGDRRLIAESILSQPFQHLIGAHGPVTFQQDFQRAAAHGGQADAVGGGLTLGRFHDGAGAGRMIVIVERIGTGQIGQMLG